MPFTEETLDFMALNRVMDSREWFHQHRGEYLRLVVEPMAELVEDMAPAMWKIDPRSLSSPRWARASRASGATPAAARDWPIYRDVMWITLLRAKYEGYPSFWFEFSPRCLRWGCAGIRPTPPSWNAYAG